MAIDSKIIDLGLYSAFSIFLIYEIGQEANDLYSNQDKDHPDAKDFGDGYGKFIYWNKFTSGDTFKNLIEKTKKLGSHQAYLPVWRRNLILAVLASIIIMITVHKKLISFSQFFLYVIIIFSIFHYSFNFYHYHYEKYATESLHKNLDIIEKNFKRKVKFKRKSKEKK